jgi:DNA-binding beta-propeller fold protein YncE
MKIALLEVLEGNKVIRTFLYIKNIISKVSVFTLIAALILPFVQVTNTRAQNELAFIRQAGVIDTDEIGLTNPAGLAFSGLGNAFHIADARQISSNHTDLVKVTPLAEQAGHVQVPAAVQNPINMAFDVRFNRLLLLNAQENQLFDVRPDSNGNLKPLDIIRYNVNDLGLQNPQGMTVDPENGTLFILDAALPSVIQVQPLPDGSFNGTSVSEINLQPNGFSSLRGIAFESFTNHLFVINPTRQELYELTLSGELTATRDLAQFSLKDPRAIVFAPSGDQTDDPAQTSLYVADTGLVEEQPSSQSTGQIVELSFTALVDPAVASFTSSLIRTTDMAAISPPSPDPSGIAYLPNSNTLLIVDGEVEETVSGISHFQGTNVWELTLSGSKVRTTNISNLSPTVTAITNEPTGIALNPSNRHYYVTDDDDKRVYDINPKTDGLIGTSDDIWTYFSTNGAGSGDPEGITFNTWNNHIFIADGVNMEIYEFTTTGTLVNHFDVQRYGVADPESVEFNVDSGTLFIMSSNRSTRVIIETTISGDLIQTIDVSVTNPVAAAGLAYAPASDGSGAKRFYIVDRGIDNNSNPNAVDGKMYEITAPVFTATFADVPTTHWAWAYIERLYSAGITNGCNTSPMMYCPSVIVTRDQMAIFLLKGKHGANYVPPAATGVFQDVPINYWAAAWIEQLAAEGVTSGCSVSPLKYCPTTAVTRDQMAVFLLRAAHGSSYVPPNATGIFQDVPTSYWAADWIEQLATEGITGGCSNGNYCPTNPVTRDQMAVFLVKNFNLP